MGSPLGAELRTVRATKGYQGLSWELLETIGLCRRLAATNCCREVIGLWAADNDKPRMGAPHTITGPAWEVRLNTDDSRHPRASHAQQSVVDPPSGVRADLSE